MECIQCAVIANGTLAGAPRTVEYDLARLSLAFHDTRNSKDGAVHQSRDGIRIRACVAGSCKEVDRGGEVFVLSSCR